jgi:hypothetical protein
VAVSDVVDEHRRQRRRRGGLIVAEDARCGHIQRLVLVDRERLVACHRRQTNSGLNGRGVALGYGIRWTRECADFSGVHNPAFALGPDGERDVDDLIRAEVADVAADDAARECARATGVHRRGDERHVRREWVTEPHLVRLLRAHILDRDVVDEIASWRGGGRSVLVDRNVGE